MKGTRITPGASMRKSVVTAPRRTIKVGRNDPCPCESGKKYKDCCLPKGEKYLVKMYQKQGKIEKPSVVKSLIKMLKPKKKGA